MRLLFPFKSLRAGLLLTYLALIVGSLGLLVWRVGSSLDASRFSETRRDQEGRAILAASAAEDWLVNFRDKRMDLGALEEETATLSREISQPVVLLDSRGLVLVDSERGDETGADHSSLPEVIAALEGRSTSFVRYDPDDKGDALFSVSPVNNKRELVGIVRLELPMRLVDETRQQFWLRILGAAMAVAAATIVVSLLFARGLTSPITQISRAANEMANGNLNQRIRVRGPNELEQLAGSFNFMAERISRVMQDQRAFVASAAHELRTPLTTIRLRAEALNEGAKDDPEVASQFLKDITNETDRLSRLVDDLLDLSRIETGLQTPRREPVSIEKVARAVVEQFAERAKESGLALDLKTSGTPATVNANPDQMRQVFINLISNALKFTSTGGKIQVEVGVRGRSNPMPELPPGRWVLATVRDSGIGIPPEDLPHIFERFYRGDKARARESAPGFGGGVGLGLAIVKSIVDAHAGRIWAKSERGKGTSIMVALPLFA